MNQRRHVEKDKVSPSRSALRRQREREQRLQTILEAAGTLFSLEGYHRTSMEWIADKAEVSVGTVYFYFKNKEDLLLKLLDQTGYELRNLLGKEFKNADGTLAGFERAGMVFFTEFCPRHPHQIALIFRESVGQSDLVETHRKKIFDKLIDDLKIALASVSHNLGPFRSEMAEDIIAASILGMFERLAYQYLIWQDRPADLEAVGRDAVAFIVGGIRNLLHTAHSTEEAARHGNN